MRTARRSANDNDWIADLNVGHTFGQHPTQLIEWGYPLGLKLGDRIRGFTV